MLKKIKKSIVKFLEKVTDALSYEKVAKKYLISGRFYSWDYEHPSEERHYVGFSFDGKTFGVVVRTERYERDGASCRIMNGTIDKDIKGRLICSSLGEVSNFGYASWCDVCFYFSHYRKVSAKTKDATIPSSKPISLIRTPEYTEAIFKVKEFIRP